MTSRALQWDWGTAYDLFVSLAVLHDPAEFGVRGAWAAGVRARLPAESREVLERSQVLLHIPLHWIYALPRPKDATAVLWALGQVSPAERLPLLALSPDVDAQLAEVLRQVAANRAWSDLERQALADAYHRACSRDEAKEAPSAEKLEIILASWAEAEEFGEALLQALHSYYQLFFAEEEMRIGPALERALARAQELAGGLNLFDLLEELSQGLRFDVLPEASELVLAPSYWCTPLVVFGRVRANRDMWLFGARPPDASLVPGETVPEGLLRSLKALSDPSRLRILHDLSHEPLTPSELARRLRLRAPTVTHHLKILRLAGLVQMTLGEARTTKCYATRPDGVASACASLKEFLEKDENGD
jgi:DNA-binding HxlR family transcriptional regulator